MLIETIRGRDSPLRDDTVPRDQHGGPRPYRADVDGLRALAVLPVIAFHMGVQAVSGGFVGVDIFFVISGYVISSRILSDVESGQFSLTNFYVRRIQRIFPALATMLIVTAMVAAVLVYPSDLLIFGESLVAASLSFSNIYFWWTADYFGRDAKSIELLHTWSLSIEEQYYLIFPIFVILLYRWKPRFDMVLWGILSGTLVASTLEAITDPMSAFYLPQHRIWEFLLGTMIVRRRYESLERPMVREGAAWLGLGLIVASIFLLDHRMPFPGLAALPACLGTVLVIAAGAQGRTVLGLLLGSAPLRAIGLISYSLYLWHWPVIVFYKAWKPTQFLSFSDKILLAAAILLLALLSWQLVEQPFRRSRRSPRIVFTMAATTAATLVALGAVIISNAGFPMRFSERELAILADLENHAPARDPACFGSTRDRFDDFDAGRCLASDPDKPDVLLLGDSHASHLWFGLSRHSGANVMELTSNGCPPTFRSRESDDALCVAIMEYAYRKIPELRPDLVVLAARWTTSDLKALEESIDWFRSHDQPVMIVGPIIEYGAELPKLLALSEHRDMPELIESSRDESRFKVDAEVADLAVRKTVPYLSLLAALCPDPPTCLTRTPGGVAMQFDYGHLTADGSDFLVGKVLDGRSILEIAKLVE